MASKVPTKKQRRRLAALMEQLDWFYGVSNQERNIHYAKQQNAENPDCTADIVIDEAYQRMTITIYPSFWDSTPENQREYITHEYTHYLIQPIQKIARALQHGRLHTAQDVEDAVEKATSSVAIMVDALLSGHRRYMLKAYKDYLAVPKKKKKTNATNTTKIKKRTRAKARV